MTPANKLLELAGRGRPFNPRDLDYPNWDAKRWRWEYYVDSEIAALWSNLPIEAKIIAYLSAVRAADADQIQP
jgi:hypothetical protein